MSREELFNTSAQERLGRVRIFVQEERGHRFRVLGKNLNRHYWQTRLAQAESVLRDLDAIQTAMDEAGVR